MRIIPTAVHGVMDYLGGLLLIAVPWIFGFARGGAETWILVAAGVFMLMAAVLTNYELGVVHLIPMPAHLTMDAILGLVLAVSPWLFQFSNQVWIPHVVLGVGEFLGAIATKTQPTRRSATSAMGIS